MSLKSGEKKLIYVRIVISILCHLVLNHKHHKHSFQKQLYLKISKVATNDFLLLGPIPIAKKNPTMYVK